MEPHIQIDRRFAIIDEWVLDLPVSDRAIRLYAVLVRYADKDTHKAFPSRKTLAKRLRCSTKSVDRAIQELIDSGLLSKEQRFNSSLVFTVHTLATPVSRGVDSGDQGGWTPESRGVDTSDDLTITTELDPKELEILNDIAQKFDEFWDAYPRKKGKGQARKAFERALKKTDMETILEGVREYIANGRWEDEQFIAYPATWLNGERWSDEYGSKAVRATPGPGKREWVKQYHYAGQHWACNPGEFPEGCE